ncbi:MAG TPA: hypothetical protein VNP20_06695 [Nocardioidaceae bacterium]|nr:hypothetical protein [Nocardioidaceae bacterium]
MVRYAFAAATAALMLVAGGCGQSDDPSGSPSAAEPEESVNESPTPDRESPGSPGQPRGAAADAVADLSQRLGAEEAQIGVASVEEVTWRDGSMGCPRPGMMYPQVLTDGTRVVLEYDGKRYEYHSGGRRSAFLCENPEPPAPR